MSSLVNDQTKTNKDIFENNILGHLHIASSSNFVFIYFCNIFFHFT